MTSYTANYYVDEVDYQVKRRRAKTGLRFLLAAITSLFFLFITALLIRSQYYDWEPLSAPWNPLASPIALWVNTFLLAISSVCIQCAKISINKHKLLVCQQFMLLTGIFTFAFLIGQLWLWQQLVDLGFYAASNPANGFFYMLTGIHGLHMVGGLIAWGKVSLLARQAPMEEYRNGIELCTTYWHYLLGIWLVLLTLLISKPETFAAIASFCGF